MWFKGFSLYLQVPSKKCKLPSYTSDAPPRFVNFSNLANLSPTVLVSIVNTSIVCCLVCISYQILSKLFEKIFIVRYSRGKFASNYIFFGLITISARLIFFISLLLFFFHTGVITYYRARNFCSDYIPPNVRNQMYQCYKFHQDCAKILDLNFLSNSRAYCNDPEISKQFSIWHVEPDSPFSQRDVLCNNTKFLTKLSNHSDFSSEADRINSAITKLKEKSLPNNVTLTRLSVPAKIFLSSSIGIFPIITNTDKALVQRNIQAHFQSSMSFDPLFIFLNNKILSKTNENSKNSDMILYYLLLTFEEIFFTPDLADELARDNRETEGWFPFKTQYYHEKEISDKYQKMFRDIPFVTPINTEITDYLIAFFCLNILFFPFKRTFDYVKNIYFTKFGP